MSLEHNALPVFAGHQTFHPRFGWLKKGLDAAAEDPDVFNADDAPLRLGVGKNMVEAIRFWCLATRVTARVRNPARKRTYLSVPTRLGQALLGKDGLDPYFEHPGTLWVLHWQAVSAPTMLPVWWSTFNDLQALEFDDAQLLQLCTEEVEATTWDPPLSTSVKKDVDCLLRMYSRRAQSGRQTVDDLLDSPFRELGLIVPSAGDPKAHRFARGSKGSLPSSVIVYAALDFMARTGTGAGTLSIARLTNDPGSPGRIFKLSEENLLSSLETHNDESLYQLAAPGGAPQLVVDGSPDAAATLVLLAYYKGEGVRTPKSATLAGPSCREPDPAHLPGSIFEVSETASKKGSAA